METKPTTSSTQSWHIYSDNTTRKQLYNIEIEASDARSCLPEVESPYRTISAIWASCI